MHDFAQHARIQQAEIVNGRDAVIEAFDQVQQSFKFCFGEQVINADVRMRTTDAIYAAISWTRRIGFQVRS